MQLKLDHRLERHTLGLLSTLCLPAACFSPFFPSSPLSSLRFSSPSLSPLCCPFGVFLADRPPPLPPPMLCSGRPVLNEIVTSASGSGGASGATGSLGMTATSSLSATSASLPALDLPPEVRSFLPHLSCFSVEGGRSSGFFVHACAHPHSSDTAIRPPPFSISPPLLDCIATKGSNFSSWLEQACGSLTTSAFFSLLSSQSILPCCSAARLPSDAPWPQTARCARGCDAFTFSCATSLSPSAYPPRSARQ